AGLIDVASPNTESPIHHWWVIKHKSFFRGWRPVGIQNFYIRLQKVVGKLPRIGNRGRATNKLRLAAIKIRNAPQASQHITEMAAKYASVGMQFIQDDISDRKSVV